MSSMFGAGRRFSSGPVSFVTRRTVLTIVVATAFGAAALALAAAFAAHPMRLHGFLRDQRKVAGATMAAAVGAWRPSHGSPSCIRWPRRPPPSLDEP